VAMSIDKIGLASGCGAEEYRDWKNTLFQSYDPLGSMEIEMKFRWKDLMSRKEQERSSGDQCSLSSPVPLKSTNEFESIGSGNEEIMNCPL